MAEHQHLLGVGRHSFGFPPEAFDPSILPDIDHEFLAPDDLDAFAQALQAPDPLQSPPADDVLGARFPGSKSVGFFDITKRESQIVEEDPATVIAAASAAAGDVSAPVAGPSGPAMFITAQNDWAPVNEKVYRKGRRRRRRGDASFAGGRTKDETREGLFYALLRWPILLLAIAWLAGLGITYLLTRFYIWIYEHFITWRGRRERLRRNMRMTSNYQDWVVAAKELDGFLGRQRWKEENEFAYYDSKTVRKVWEQMRKCRAKAESDEPGRGTSRPSYQTNTSGKPTKPAVEDLKALVEACVKNDFVGIENPRLYSQTYHGTKNLVQNFIDEGMDGPCIDLHCKRTS
jgi:Domain of unknown function (DUF3336)